VTENVTASLAWMHGFRNAIEGPILQLPGSSVRLDAQLNQLWAGVNIKFGGSKRKGPATAMNSGSLDSPPPSSWSGPYIPSPPNPGDPPSATSVANAYDPATAPRVPRTGPSPLPQST
jgi:hypothetical protein